MKIPDFYKNLAIGLLLLAPSLGLALGEDVEPLDPQVPVKVTAQHVIKQNIPAQTELVGTIQAVQRAVIAAKVTGTIEDMPVVLGSQVNQGDLLVKISAKEITARLLQAQAQLEQTRRNLEREKKLLQKKAATSETVKSLEDMHKVAKAAYEEAKTMLDYTTITAPFSGFISAKPANAGDLATPGTPLLKLANHEKLQATASVPESLLPRIKRGDTLVVRVPSAQLRTTGVVAEIAPAADPLTRSAPIKIDLDREPYLRPGQFARITLPGREARVLLLPASAISRKGQIERCFVIKDDKAVLKLIRTGMYYDGQYEVLSGLEPEDLVITEKVNQLVEGQSVYIMQ